MLTRGLRAQERALLDIVGPTLDYFERVQLDDGSIAEDPATLIFQEWDSVNALKAMAIWRDVAGCERPAVVDGILGFLRSRETSGGMLRWGEREVGPGEYCTETSAEYVSALTLLGREDEARPKAGVLRSRQLPSGAWAEMHPHIPNAFQTEPSVTGFALDALMGLDVEPLYLDDALAFLVRAQKDEGHFGINWYYYNTHYYLLRPAVSVLATFGHHAAVARARAFTLSDQRADGSWYSEVEGFEGLSSPELHTALALRTLAHTGMTAADAHVARAIGWLLERRREDGSWDGGRYPYPDTPAYSDFRATQHVYTTAQVLTAFRQLRPVEGTHDRQA